MIQVNTKINQISPINVNRNQITKIAQNKEFVELITVLYWFDVPNITNLLCGDISLEECCSRHNWLYKVLYNKQTLFEEKKAWLSGRNLYLKSNLSKDLRSVFPNIRNKNEIGIHEVNLLLSQVLSINLSIRVTPENLYKVCGKYKTELLNFSNIDLSNTNLSNLDLSGLNFQGTIFDGSILKGTNFTGSNLKLAILINTDLTRTNFTKANLCQANLSQARINLTIFHEANFTWVKFTSPNQSKTRKVIWHGGDLRRSDCTGTDFRNVVFEKYPRISLTYGDARHSFSYQIYPQLSECLTESNFMYANFSSLDLSNINFSMSYLSYANFNGANMQYTDFTNATLKGITILGAKLSNATPINSIILNAYVLHWLIFNHTDLVYNDLLKEIFKTLIQLAAHIPRQSIMPPPL